METLAVVEILGRRGEVVARERLHRFPAVVGRAFDADVILDDPHVAPRHLEITMDEAGGFRLADLGSQNGHAVLGDGESASVADWVAAGGTVRLGHSQIRIWRADSPVAPELPVRAVPSLLPAAGSVALLLLAAALAGLVAWLAGTGSSRDGFAAFGAMAAAGFILAWAGVWWLASGQLRERSSFLPHLGVGGLMVCLILAGDYAAETLRFAFGLYDGLAAELGDLSLWLAVSYGVYRHLRLNSRRRRRVLAAIALLCVGGLLLSSRHVLGAYDRDKVGEMAIPAALRPPWMRVVEGVSPERFIDAAMGGE